MEFMEVSVQKGVKYRGVKSKFRKVGIFSEFNQWGNTHLDSDHEN